MFCTAILSKYLLRKLNLEENTSQSSVVVVVVVVVVAVVVYFLTSLLFPVSRLTSGGVFSMRSFVSVT